MREVGDKINGGAVIADRSPVKPASLGVAYDSESRRRVIVQTERSLTTSGKKSNCPFVLLVQPG